MRIARDKNGLSLSHGDKVTVQIGDGPKTAGEVTAITPQTTALEGCVLVAFDNDTAQWMDGKHLRIRSKNDCPKCDSANTIRLAVPGPPSQAMVCNDCGRRFVPGEPAAELAVPRV